MIKLFCYCVIAICFTTNVMAQDCTYTFKGKIIDFHNNTPIYGASVQIKNLNKYTSTNQKGEFEFKNLCKGELVIEVQHIACETKNSTITINQNLYKEILLEHHLEELNEVVVKTNFKTEATSIEQSIKKNVLEGYSDKSLGDALKNVSGVSSLNTGNTIVKPMIHGLHSSRLLIINNNVRMFDQEWGDEHAPNIDINANNSIEVIKGANTLKFGSDAIGGMILIKPKKYAIKDSLFGSTLVSFNSNGLGGNINSEIVKTYKSGFYGKIQMNYKQFGDFKAPDYYLTNSGTISKNASFRFGYNSFEKGFDAYYSYVDNEFAILQSSHIGNVNDLVNAINSQEPRVIEDFSYEITFPKQSILHHLGKIEAYKRFKGFGKLTVQYDFQINRRKEFDLRRGDLSNTPVIDLRLFTNSLQTDLRIDYSDNLKINTGILARYQQNDAVAGTGTSPLIPDYDKYVFGTYIIGNYDINESTEVSAGVRYDFSRIDAQKEYNVTDWRETYNYDELFPEFEAGEVDGTDIPTNPNFSYHNISASLGLSKQFENNMSLLVNYGLASRVPNPSELFSDGLHHSAARIEIGLLTMEKETANKFAISLEKNSDNFGFSVSPYFKHIRNYIQLIPVGITTTIRGAFPVWQYNQINAQIFGVDLDVNKKINSKFDYKGSLSLLRGDNTSEDIPLIHMPAANFSNRISYTNNALNKLKISLTHKSVLQQKRYPDYNFYTFNAIAQENVFVDISSTPPAYSLFNLNTSAVFKAFNKGSLELEFNIENLFDVSYREHLNRLRYFADELGRNFNFKIKIKY
ncbi:TonB-dependent receptor [Polaribacter vadi]|uniref:TonB-dependent receptor n=1 Tax=Polaribacter TaxID=52959 RepID=UPI001C0A2D90|nr:MULTISPECIES: TonB-dependent receptor [Polaribacter]MBU3012003.1 TonB-dependent receptor [Polaribacter vadi]MDO6741818.1 TonB-dependent receptor [Polaribacter sp. 1_MG-2023]